jgi:hypothetical protein
LLVGFFIVENRNTKIERFICIKDCYLKMILLQKEKSIKKIFMIWKKLLFYRTAVLRGSSMLTDEYDEVAPESLTGDDQPTLGSAQSCLSCQSVFGSTLVRLVSILRSDISDVQFPRGQYQVLAICTTDNLLSVNRRRPR